MKIEAVICLVIAVLELASAAKPTVNCPVPVSPPHGQVQLYHSGLVVRYACDPGYKLIGARQASCVGNTWQPDPPICQLRDASPTSSVSEATLEDLKTTTPRPLFKWDDEEELKAKANETDEDMLSDEARLRLLLFPERRVVTTRVQRVRSGSELEEEEQKRAKSEKPTSVHVEAPSVVYVKRPLASSKTASQEEHNLEHTLLEQYNRAALHLVGNDVVHLPRVVVSDGKGVQSEEAWRQAYWMAQYMSPRQAAMVVHATAAGQPVVMTLTESQMAWINSLHPELRDRYLKDLYNIRAKEVEEGARAQAFLRRYEDATHWLYSNPYYMRQPLSVIVEDPVSTFDYSCYQTEEDGRITRVRAPALSHAYIHRYDRRQNPNYPHNDYLAAEYRCHAGYTLADYRYSELYCRQKGWVGKMPVCLPID